MPKLNNINLKDSNSLNLKVIEDQVITIAMARADGHRGTAAKLLGISDRTLQRKLRIRSKKDET